MYSSANLSETECFRFGLDNNTNAVLKLKNGCQLAKKTTTKSWRAIITPKREHKSLANKNV